MLIKAIAGKSSFSPRLDNLNLSNQTSWISNERVNIDEKSSIASRAKGSGFDSRQEWSAS